MALRFSEALTAYIHTYARVDHLVHVYICAASSKPEQQEKKKRPERPNAQQQALQFSPALLGTNNSRKASAWSLAL